MNILTDAYNLPIPNGWAAENRGRTIAVYRSDGVGAVNISSMRRPGKPATEDELREYLRDDLKVESTVVSPVRIGEFVGISAEYEARGSCWRIWLLAYGDRVVYFTYNCKPEFRGQEYDAVDALVGKLSPVARPAG